MDSEYIYALQSYYLPKYQELFKVIAYLGGCIICYAFTPIVGMMLLLLQKRVLTPALRSNRI